MSVRVSTLPNGLTVISHDLEHLETVALGLWVWAGSRDERKDEAGLAHFLEHMAFKGTKRRSAYEIVAAIEDRGGDLNATTTAEYTGYTAHVLADDWAVALDVIADIVCEPVFDPHEMERERGVILQEIAAANDDPEDVAFSQADRLAFLDHPLGRPILGTPEVVTRLTPEDLAAFRARHYGARRMVLTAAGRIDHEALLDEAGRLLSSIPTGHAARRERPIFHPGEAATSRPQDQAHIVLAWPFPGYRDDAIWTAIMLSSILGGGMSSRLFQELREKRGLCYSTYSYRTSFADAGALYLYAATAPQRAEEASALMLKVAQELQEDIRPQELARAQAQARAALVMELESASARCGQLARQFFAWKRVRPLREFADIIAAITAEEVRALAAEVFAADHVRSLVLPGEDPHAATGEEDTRPVTLH